MKDNELYCSLGYGQVALTYYLWLILMHKLMSEKGNSFSGFSFEQMRKEVKVGLNPRLHIKKYSVALHPDRSPGFAVTHQKVSSMQRQSAGVSGQMYVCGAEVS